MRIRGQLDRGEPVNDASLQELRQLVRQRVLAQSDQIRRSLVQINAGNPLGAEPSQDRRVRRIAAKTSMPIRDVRAVASVIEQNAVAIDQDPNAAGGESLQGPTIDFVGVEFLVKGRIAANAVGRVAFRSGRAEGSGFLVAPGVFLTNHHVIDSVTKAAQLCVEFDYEAADDGSSLPVTRFEFAPSECFITHPVAGLDFTLIAIGQRLSGGKTVAEFGYLPLSDADDKHMLGEIANIIQHPNGNLKQVVVRENNLVSRDETHEVLHYFADTEKGSSGSPVLNNHWEPIALHHWGEPWLELKDADGRPLRRDVNEGIRISAIVKYLRGNTKSFDTASRNSVEKSLAAWKKNERVGPVAPQTEKPSAGNDLTPNSRNAVATSQTNGTISWIFPIEITVRSPLLNDMQPIDHRPADFKPNGVDPEDNAIHAEARRSAREIEDFSDRGGYEPGFLPGFIVPIPSFDGVRYRLALNRQAERDDDPHELRYHHFSIFMNRDRRLAAVTCCNIDGARSVAIDRANKTVNLNPTLKKLGVESLGAEASDDFRPDDRVSPTEQMAREFYEEQKVPGFPKPDFPGRDAAETERKKYARLMAQRTARMLQKGHIIMRGDPAWGSETEALAAESDTFFYTNAAPQFGFFNQGSEEDRPGSKGKLRWRAVETYILRNAFVQRQRVCVFAGPVFDDENDPPYRLDSQVPMQFWKIAIWVEDGELQAIAVIADQRPVFEKLTRGMPEAAENFNSPDELARLHEHLTTIARIEELTGLKFAEEIRKADVRQGQDTMSVADTDEDEGGIKPTRPRTGRGRRGNKKRPP